MKLVVKTNKIDFYEKYYQAINGILKLSKTELKVLTLLSLKKLQGISDNELLSTEMRLELSKELDITKFSLNNYIKTLKDRSILVKDNRKLKINSAIYIDINNLDSTEFLLKFNIN